VFSFDPATLVGGVPTLISGTLNPGPTQTTVNRTVTKHQAPGALASTSTGVAGRLEDSWGIALLYQVAQGNLANPGSPGSQVGFTGPIGYDNSAGTQGTWLNAVFYGGVDIQVVVTQGNGLGLGQNGIAVGQQRAQSLTEGLQFKMWAVDSATMVATGSTPGTKDSVNLVDYVPGNRVDLDTYTGWTGDTLAGSVLLVSATQKFFQSSIVVDPSFTIVSNPNDASTLYWDIDKTNLAAGWNPIIGGDPDMLTSLDGVGGVFDTNFWAQYTLDVGQRGWNVHSNDIAGFYALVPEPVTILGVILGVGSLGGYIRRRFHA
jgi:hypothetical protein